ncbi:MAG: HU family DNA-binding protein [Microcystaceae cyanobacterium]
MNASREVKITDFLTFTFKDVGDRVRRNPRTNERVLKEPSRFPRVRFSAVFEGNVKQNGIPLIQQTDDETPKRG